MIKNLEQTLIKQVGDAKAEVEESIFNAWRISKEHDERESLHAELRALDKLTFRLTKSIRGRNDG